jgi:hypothetical protein
MTTTYYTATTGTQQNCNTTALAATAKHKTFLQEHELLQQLLTLLRILKLPQQLQLLQLPLQISNTNNTAIGLQKVHINVAKC